MSHTQPTADVCMLLLMLVAHAGVLFALFARPTPTVRVRAVAVVAGRSLRRLSHRPQEAMNFDLVTRPLLLADAVDRLGDVAVGRTRKLQRQTGVSYTTAAACKRSVVRCSGFLTNGRVEPIATNNGINARASATFTHFCDEFGG